MLINCHLSEKLNEPIDSEILFWLNTTQMYAENFQSIEIFREDIFNCKLFPFVKYLPQKQHVQGEKKYSLFLCDGVDMLYKFFLTNYTIY